MTFDRIEKTTATSGWSRTATVLVAAAISVGISVGEASAKSAKSAKKSGAWTESNASVGGGRSFSGMASYYGNESGSRTASGQRFNQHAMTCAHRSLPFGTRLKVTHGERSVIVTVNDRGPFIRGRVLDLSTGAARAIGITSQGVARVVAEIM